MKVRESFKDQEWILDGANGPRSMVGFDDGSQTERTLDGEPGGPINPDLTVGADVTTAARLPGIAFKGDTKVWPFEIPPELTTTILALPNPNGRPNSDVLRPWANGLDMTRRGRDMWIVDFPPGTTRAAAALYEVRFAHINEHVRPMRATARSGDATGVPWWIHQRPRPDMRAALVPLLRYLGASKLPAPPTTAGG